jgi:hypothetical protein
MNILSLEFYVPSLLLRVILMVYGITKISILWRGNYQRNKENSSKRVNLGKVSGF